MLNLKMLLKNSKHLILVSDNLLILNYLIFISLFGLKIMLDDTSFIGIPYQTLKILLAALKNLLIQADTLLSELLTPIGCTWLKPLSNFVNVQLSVLLVT